MAAADLSFPEDGDAPFCLALGLSNCRCLIRVLNAVLLAHVPHADLYLLAAACFLACLAVAQKLDVFTRPPPVPPKALPPRPVLQVSFKPDDVIGTASSAAATAATTSSSATPGARPDDVSLFSDPPSPPSVGVGRFRRGASGSSARSGLSAGPSPRPNAAAPRPRPPPPRRRAASHGLPDSFAPLLSSSEMEVRHN